MSIQQILTLHCVIGFQIPPFDSCLPGITILTLLGLVPEVSLPLYHSMHAVQPVYHCPACLLLLVASYQSCCMLFSWEIERCGTACTNCVMQAAVG